MTDKPSLTTMFENATLIRFRGMRVKQIKRVSDNVLLYNDPYSIRQDIPVSIHWNHEYDSSSRPDSVSCTLYADGVEFSHATLNEGNAWRYTFKNLRVYDDNNHKIEYTLDIPSIDRYEKTVSYTEGAGFGVLYAYQYGTLRIRYRIVCEDGTYGGEDPKSNLGSYSFTVSGPDSRMPLTITYAQFEGDLYELDSLAPGTYSVSCTNAQDLADAVYAEIVSDSILSSTNTVEDDSTTTLSLFIHLASTTPDEPEEPDTIDIPITLTWDDNDNVDGNRPDQVTIRVYAGGEEIYNGTLSADTNWTYTLEEYPKYSDGHLIRYSLQTDPTDWYRTTINNFDIIETYSPETTNQSVRIIWNDNNNSAGIRPSSVQATLKANGTAYSNPLSLSEDNGWDVIYTGLPTKINKQTVTYTWEIPSVTGYEIYSTQTSGTLTIFTLQKQERPDNPPVPDSGGNLTLTLKEEALDSITIGLIATVDNEVYSRPLVATVYKNNEILTNISGVFDSSFEETITSAFNNGDIIYCEATHKNLGIMQSNSVTIQNIFSDELLLHHSQDFNPLTRNAIDELMVSIIDEEGNLISSDEPKQIKIYKNNTYLTTVNLSPNGVAFKYYVDNTLSDSDVLYCVEETTNMTSDNITIKKPYSTWIEIEYEHDYSNRLQDFWGSSVLLNENDIDEYSSIYIDWGDNGEIETVTPSSPYGYSIDHTYENAGNYTVKIYGNIYATTYWHLSGASKITFSDTVKYIGIIGTPSTTQTLKEINISKSVTYIQETCFGNYPTSLEKIYLNWTSSDEILPYNEKWFYKMTQYNGDSGWPETRTEPTSEVQEFNDVSFVIPPNTTQLYIDKGYPSRQLVWYVEEEYDTPL